MRNNHERRNLWKFRHFWKGVGKGLNPYVEHATPRNIVGRKKAVKKGKTGESAPRKNQSKRKDQGKKKIAKKERTKRLWGGRSRKDW